MKLTKKHNVLLGFFIFIGLFATTRYGKEIVHSISILHQDTFIPYIKKNLEQASELEMQELLQVVVKKAYLKYPMKKSKDELDIDLLYDINNLMLDDEKLTFCDNRKTFNFSSFSTLKYYNYLFALI